MKRITTTVTKEFDADGKLKKEITETVTEEDNPGIVFEPYRYPNYHPAFPTAIPSGPPIVTCRTTTETTEETFENTENA